MARSDPMNIMQVSSNRRSIDTPQIAVEHPVKGLHRAFMALRHRNFRLFWLGQLISLIGTWMQSTAQAWLVLILASLIGLTNAFDMPTRQAFVVEMVGREDLPNAVALNSSLFNMARIVGPGIGGLLIAWLGVAPLFLLNAISFIPVIAGLALIDMKQLHASVKPSDLLKDAPRKGTIQSLREGL